VTSQAALVTTQGQKLSPVDTLMREKDWCASSFTHQMPFRLSTLVRSPPLSDGPTCARVAR
jgi:hypothetical protein